MADLTDKQSRILRHVTSGWSLAYDIAQAAEVDNRPAGIVLASLEKKGLVRSKYDEEKRAKLWSLV
jgi:DNA-binding MarR family transcriptional regulator